MGFRKLLLGLSMAAAVGTPVLAEESEWLWLRFRRNLGWLGAAPVGVGYGGIKASSSISYFYFLEFLFPFLHFTMYDAFVAWWKNYQIIIQFFW
jgi:hypothetical protein